MDHGDMGGGMPQRCKMSVRLPLSVPFLPSPYSLPPLSSVLFLPSPVFNWPPANPSPQMLFTWDTTDLCIVFRSWHIRGTPSLLVSLLAIVLLVAGYEALRSATQRFELSTLRRTEALGSESSPPFPLSQNASSPLQRSLPSVMPYRPLRSETRARS